MGITVLKHNVPWGPFTRDQIREGLARGDFTLHYLAHATGLKDWLPLGEVLDYVDRGATLPPLPGSPNVPAPPPVSPALVASTGGLIGERMAASRPPALPIRQTAAPQLAESPPAVPAPPLPTPGKILKPAPLVLRFMALVIDCGVLFIPIIFLFFFGAIGLGIHGLWDRTDRESMNQSWALLQRNFYQAITLVALVWSWLYAAGLEASRWQGTIGKQWMGMKVSDWEGERISFLRASGRHFAKYLSGLPIGIGFLMAFFGSRRLALHDRLSGTRVIR